MRLIEHLHPPAFLDDFDRVRGLRDQWSQAVSNWLDAAVDIQREAFRQQHIGNAELQFFNPIKQPLVGKTLRQPVVWNAFPKQLIKKRGLQGALKVADALSPLSQFGKATRHLDGYFRLGSEYCEWRVTRDSKSSHISKIIFTSESPEYWRALFGGSIEYSPETGHASVFSGAPHVVLQLYKELVSNKVELRDLRAPDDIAANGIFPTISKGEYNPFNKWNTTDGIVHLTHPSNSILAEINLAAAATILRKDNRNRVLVRPEELICCAGYGNPNRNSDPTIGAAVNALARQGARISLQDPVGVYMDHIDLAGWAAPNNEDVGNFVRITRGRPGMITRLEVEVPPGRGFQVGNLTIGGVPISYGGQVAECITVKLVVIATQPQSVQNPKALKCPSICYVTETDPLELKVGMEVPPDGQAVFVREGEQDSISEAGQNEARYREHLGGSERARQKAGKA